MPTDREPLPAFFEAAELAARLLADDAVGNRWQEPSALDGFSVGGLAGHIYATVRRVEVALDEAAPVTPVVVGPVEFYGANRVDEPSDLTAGLHPYVREEGEQRAARFGVDGVRQRFGDLLTRLRERLPEEPGDRTVPVLQVPDGVTPLPTYLATRVVELVVHSDDLSVSVDLPPIVVPEQAAPVVIGTLVELARGRSGDLEIVRALARAERATPDVLRAL
jgi:hypothetical protein